VTRPARAGPESDAWSGRVAVSRPPAHAARVPGARLPDSTSGLCRSQPRRPVPVRRPVACARSHYARTPTSRSCHCRARSDPLGTRSSSSTSACGGGGGDATGTASEQTPADPSQTTRGWGVGLCPAPSGLHAGSGAAPPRPPSRRASPRVAPVCRRPPWQRLRLVPLLVVDGLRRRAEAEDVEQLEVVQLAFARCVGARVRLDRRQRQRRRVVLRPALLLASGQSPPRRGEIVVGSREPGLLLSALVEGDELLTIPLLLRRHPCVGLRTLPLGGHCCCSSGGIRRSRPGLSLRMHSGGCGGRPLSLPKRAIAPVDGRVRPAPLLLPGGSWSGAGVHHRKALASRESGLRQAASGGLKSCPGWPWTCPRCQVASGCHLGRLVNAQARVRARAASAEKFQLARTSPRRCRDHLPPTDHTAARVWSLSPSAACQARATSRSHE
jgi:hypothetical protein